MKKLVPYLISMIFQVIKGITPDLRRELLAAVNNLEVKAKGTKNPFDDILVGLLKGLLED